MSEELIVRFCSPTLAGLKTGSMFSTLCSDESELRRHIRRLNGLLSHKGLRFLPLRQYKGRALIYVFRPGQLSRDLQDSVASGLLEQCGYCARCPHRCLAHLVRRLEQTEEFPHEIGLFLGYPPADVLGFIQNNARNCKFMGPWKVYGDAEAAQRTFDLYEKCTRIYCQQWEQGTGLERLAEAC